MEPLPVDWVLVRELLRWDAGNYPRGPLRVSPRDLARRAGVHPNTVRLRLLALQRGGVVEGSTFDPVPGLLGLVHTGWLYEGPRPRDADALARALESFPQVQMAVLGNGVLFLHLWHDAAKERPLADAIAAALGAARWFRSFSSQDFGPPPPIRLSPLDWRLILALRRGPRRPLAQVARELRITPRTAERRARRLMELGAGAMFPRFRPGRVEGWVLAEYAVLDGGPAAAAALARAFPDRIVGPMGPGNTPNVLVPVRSVQEAERRRSEVEARPGVGTVELYLVRDILYPAAFEPWLAEAVAAAQRGAAKGQEAPAR